MVRFQGKVAALRRKVAPLRGKAAPLPALAVLALAACTTTGGGKPSFDVTQPLPAGGLGDRHPADVAVAPVHDQTPAGNVPVAAVRSALCEALVERLYSPLDPGYVDASWSESSFIGEAPPDAVLVVAVTRWDTSRLYSTGTVVADAELRLFEGGKPQGEALWAVAVTRRIELGDGHHAPTGPRRELLPRAVAIFAREALEELPERDPVAAHR